MRKGQQSLIIKAMNNRYSEACIKVLSDETMTLSTLNVLYDDLWIFKDRDEEWVERFVAIDRQCRGFIIQYQLCKGDTSVSTLEKLSSVENIIAYFSGKSVKCKNLFDAEIVLNYGSERSAMILSLFYKAAMVDKRFLEIDYYAAHWRWIEKMIAVMDRVADPKDFLDFMEANSSLQIDENIEEQEINYFYTRYFYLSSDDTISDEIKNFDFSGLSGYLYESGCSRSVSLKEGIMYMNVEPYTEIRFNIFGDLYPKNTHNGKKKSETMIFNGKTHSFIYGYSVKNSTKKKYVPARLKDVFRIISIGNSDETKENAWTVINYLCRHYHTFLFRDLYNDYLKSQGLMLPILVSEAGQYQTKQELFRDFYHLEIDGDWNKRNANLAYILCKLHCRMTKDAIERAVQCERAPIAYHVWKGQRYVMLFSLYEAVLRESNIMQNYDIKEKLEEEYKKKKIQLISLK